MVKSTNEHTGKMGTNGAELKKIDSSSASTRRPRLVVRSTSAREWNPRDRVESTGNYFLRELKLKHMGRCSGGIERHYGAPG